MEQNLRKSSGHNYDQFELQLNDKLKWNKYKLQVIL